MNRGRRRRALMLLVLLVLAAGAYVRSQLDEWVRAGLEVRLAQSLDADVRIGTLDLTLRRLAADFRDVEIDARRDNGPRITLGVTSGRVRLRLATLSALSIGRLHLAEVTLHGARCYVRAGGARSPRAGAALESPLDVVIDRLTVTSGTAAYDDREFPLEFSIDHVAVDAARGRSKLIGNVVFDYGLLAPPLERELQLAVATGFRYEGGRLDLLRFHATGEGLDLELDAEIVGSSTFPEVRAGGRARLDLDRIGALLPADAPALAGNVNAVFTAERADGPLEALGHIESGPARLGPLRVASLIAKARYEPDMLEFTDLRARAFGGRLDGTLRLGFGDDPGFETRLEGSDLSAIRLLEFLEFPLPVGGRVEARVAASGESPRTASWSGEGEYRLRADAADPRLLPASGNGEVRLVPGRLFLRAEPVHVASTRLAVEAELSVGAGVRQGEVRLSGEVSDAKETQRGTLRILEALGIATPDELHRPLAGSGSASARIGLGGAADFDLNLDLNAGSLQDRPFDRLGVGLIVQGNRLNIHRLDVADGREQLSGSARLGLDPLSMAAVDLRAEHLDLRWITERWPWDLPLVGRVSGDLRLSRGPTGLNGGGALTFEDARVFDESVAAARVALSVKDDILKLADAELRGPAGELAGSAILDLGSDRIAIELVRGNVDLAAVAALRELGVPLSGRVTAAGAFGFDGAGAGNGSLRIQGLDVTLDDYALGALEGQVDLGSEGFEARLRESLNATWNATARIEWGGDWPVAGELLVVDLPLGDAEDPDLPLAAVVTGVLDFAGPLADPSSVRVGGSVEHARLDLGTRSLALDEPVAVGIESGRIRAAPIRMSGPRSKLEASVLYDLERGRLEAGLDGTLNVALLSAWIPDLQLSGNAAVGLHVSGAPDRPLLDGSIRVEGGRLRWLAFPETLEQVDLDLRFEGDRAHTEHFEAVAGGGEVSGGGEWRLDGLALSSFQGTFDLDGVRLGIPEGFEGVYDGKLIVEGDAEQMRLSSRARLLRGLYDEPFELGGLLGFGAREVPYATGPATSYPVLLDLDVTAEGGVWLRNDLAEVETAVDLHISGTVERPEVTGQISSLEGGELLFRDIEYRIESARLEFVERERLNPYLTLQARTTVRSYEILLRLEGTQDDFQYELTSNPALSSQDIIALLTTGHTLRDLTAANRDPTRTSYTGDVAANYFAGALTGRFEKQLQRVLGLERVRIDPLLVEGESDPTTRVTIGKEVADDLFVILSSDVGDTERQIYQVEWQASPQIRLTAERDELGSLGGDVQYTDRFRLSRAADGARPAASSEPAAGATDTVQFVSIEGVPEERAEALRKRLPLRVGQPFNRSLMFDGLQTLRRIHVREGRIETRIRSAMHREESSSEVAVSYVIEVGAPLEIVFQGVKKKDERRLRGLLEDLWTDAFFSENLGRDAVALIRKYFQQRGYYAVDVVHERTEVGGKGRLVFRVDRGQPVTVDRVQVIGADAVGADRVKRQMLTREPSFLARKHLTPEVLQDDVRAIRSLYWELGYLEVRVDPATVRLSATADGAEVTIRISEGPRFEIASIAFPADLPFDEAQMREWSGLSEGDQFSPQRLVEAEGKLRSGIDEQGYPDAGVRARFRLADGAAHLSFEIEPGDQKRVGEIAIHGNRVTRRKVIEREIDLKEGDLLSRAGLLRIQHRLYGLGIFRSVRAGYRSLEGDGDRQLLEVHVEEAEPLGLSVGGGYENQGDARARLSLTHDNVAGRDRAVGLHARVSRLVRRFQFTAEERHLFGSNIPGLLNVAVEEREEKAFTVNRRSIALRADRHWGPRWSGFLRYSFQRVDLLDVTDALATRQDKLTNISLGDIGVVVLRDTRDDRFLTKRGSLLSTEIRFFGDAVLSEASFVKSIFTGAHVHTFNNGTGLVSVARLGVAKPYGDTRQVPLSERFFAGGDSTLRGFGRDEVGPQQDGLPFGGEAMILFNEDFTFPLWSPLMGALFLDVGNVYDTLSEFDPSDLREVAGVGLRLETPIGPLRLEYGWKLDRRAAESRGEWVLAIGLAF